MAAVAAVAAVAEVVAVAAVADDFLILSGCFVHSCPCIHDPGERVGSTAPRAARPPLFTTFTTRIHIHCAPHAPAVAIVP